MTVTCADCKTEIGVLKRFLYPEGYDDVDYELEPNENYGGRVEGDELCHDCLQEAETKVEEEAEAEMKLSLTKEQFDLAVKIQRAQQMLQHWETASNWHNPSDKEGYAHYERCKEHCITMYQEMLMKLTGNTRGFLPPKESAA